MQYNLPDLMPTTPVFFGETIFAFTYINNMGPEKAERVAKQMQAPAINPRDPIHLELSQRQFHGLIEDLSKGSFRPSEECIHILSAKYGLRSHIILDFYYNSPWRLYKYAVLDQ